MGGVRFGRVRLVVREQGSGRIAVKKLGRNVGLLAVLLVGLFALVPAGASAEPLCTDTWTGPAEGEWEANAYWSKGEVPSSSDVACIGTGKTAVIKAGHPLAGILEDKGSLVLSGGSLELTGALTEEPSSIASLTMSGGKLQGADQVDITGSFSGSNYSGLDGSGAVVIESGATGTISSSTLDMEGATLKNEGTLTIKGGGYINGEHSILNNSGTLIVNTEEIRLQPSSSEATLVNTGTLEKTEGSGKAILNAAVENEGSIDVTAGAFEFSHGATSENHSVGTWTASGSGTSIVFTGSSERYALGSTVKLSGKFEINDGTVSAGKIEGSAANVTVNGDAYHSSGVLEVTGATPSEIETLTLAAPYGSPGGAFGGTGKLNVASSFSAGGYATLRGSGELIIGAGATGEITSTVYQNGMTLKNAGTLTLSKTSYIKAESHAVLNNDGTLVLNTEEESLLAGKGEATLINSGVLKKTEGTWAAIVQYETENLGSIQPGAGHIRFTYPVITRESSTQWGGPGNPSTPGHPCPICGEPVVVATGDLAETQTDLSVGGRGVGLNLTRSYNSQAAAEEIKGVFGYGWTSSFSDHLVVNKTSKVTTLHQANGSTVPFTEETGEVFKAPVWTQDTLSGTEAGGYTLTLANQIKYKFAGSSGRLESVTDRDGNATMLTYNEAGQLATITDPVSRTIKLKYNGEGLVESAEDPMKHVVKYTYEGGNLKSVTQPGEAGLRWQFKYESHEMTEVLDGREGKTINEYNGSHQVIKQKDPAGHTLKFEYEPFHTKITKRNDRQRH